jgi:hypothetical protein
MTLLRRRPREVYRVYTEDEYLDGAGLELGAGPQVTAVGEWSVPVGPARKAGGERRLRRVAGVAMLAGAVGTVGGLVVMTSARAHNGAGRRPGSLVAATRSSRIVRASAPSWPVPAHRSEATRSRVAWAGRRRGKSGPRRPLHPLTRLPARPIGSVATVVDYVSRSSSAETPASTAAAGETTATDVSPSAAIPRSTAGKQAEFGFER